MTAATPINPDDPHSDVMWAHRALDGLPKFAAAWGQQEIEDWFGRKEKELERSWQGCGTVKEFITVAQHNIHDRHRRILSLIASPDFRSILLSWCERDGDTRCSPERLALERYAARFGLDLKQAPLPRSAPWWPLVAWAEDIDDIAYPGVALTMARCLGDAQGRLVTCKPCLLAGCWALD